MAQPDDRIPLRRYLKIQASADHEVIAMLKHSRDDLDRQLQAIVGNKPGAEVRREQLRLARQAINREMDRIWRQLREIIETHSLVAAKDAVRVNQYFETALLRSGLSRAEMGALEKSLIQQAQQAVQHAINRKFDESGTTRIPLSERVYHSRQVIDRQVERLVNSALARGLSAREFANEVKQFIRPDTPGGVRYAAMRLARTEINNAFHYAQTRDSSQKPWVSGQRWHLSGSHPKPDVCNDYASANHANLGPGVYRKDDVPAKPHPQCLCFVTPETESEAEFIKNLQSGRYDNYLNSRIPVGLPTKRTN